MSNLHELSVDQMLWMFQNNNRVEAAVEGESSWYEDIEGSDEFRALFPTMNLCTAWEYYLDMLEEGEELARHESEATDG